MPALRDPRASDPVRPSIAPIADPARPAVGGGLADPAKPAPAVVPQVAPPTPAHDPAPAGAAAGKWFKRAPRDPGIWNPKQVPLPVAGNLVQPLIGVLEYYAAVAATIRDARDHMGDSIYIAGWTLDLSTPIEGKHGKSLGELLAEAVQRGVEVRVLLDSSHHNGPANAVVAANIAAFGGGAVVDNLRYIFGSQHQKFLIGRTKGGIVAYCGSADFENARMGRYGNGGHIVKLDYFNAHPEVYKHVGNPWHEVMVRIQGAAAVDIWQTFVLRYRAACGPQMALVGKVAIFGPTSLIDPSPAVAAMTPGQVMVQIVRTFPNPRAGIDVLQGASLTGAQKFFYEPLKSALGMSAPQPAGYDFAPAGETSYYEALLYAISQTEHTIYLEDQYLVDAVSTKARTAITAALARAIAKPGFKKMIILIAGTPTIQDELAQAASRRREFFLQLGSAAAAKVSVFWYKFDMHSPYWFHSKTWVFDDACAVVGSANCNRRSYACDSELGAVFADGNRDRMSMVKRMRMDLCLKHLNNHAAASVGATAHQDSAVEDFVTAAATFDSVAAAGIGTLVVAPIGSDMTPDVTPKPLREKIIATFGSSAAVLKTMADFTRSTRKEQWDVIDAQAQ
nr:phospholipase D-like domain-containing protein [Massilia sp. YIM B04103]